MKLTKKISAVVLAALMAVVAIFAGCSSTKSNDDSKTNNESTTSAAKVKVVDIELSSEEYAFGVDLYFFVFYNKVYMSIYIHPNLRRKRMAYAIS